MTNSIARELVDKVPAGVTVARNIILDWVDGPVEGVLSFSSPWSDWHFRLFGENRRSDDIDDRLFALTFVDKAAVAAIFELDDEVVGNVVVQEMPPDRSASLQNLIGSFSGFQVLACFDEHMQSIERAWTRPIMASYDRYA